MSTNETAVAVRDVSKAYTIAHNAPKHTTMAEALVHRARRPFYRPAKETFWALKSLSFEVKEGEVVGVIGRNGAGKSTLLKILSRITEPTTGRIELYGRVGSLLEVGTGFHPELTGRENIYLNGQILGMRRKEIDRQFDAIVDFADVEKFLDTPVKRYSSGMYVRLAFAVAAHLSSEILIVDEVLAVGDVKFQSKCLDTMSNVARSGRTVIFVSHNMAAVQQLTQRSVVLSRGQIICDAPTEVAIAKYLEDAVDRDTSIYLAEHARRPAPDLPRDVEFVSFELLNNVNKLLAADEEVQIKIVVKGRSTVPHFRISMTIFHSNGNPVGSFFSEEELEVREGEEAAFLFVLDDLRLAPGTYYIGAATGVGNNETGHSDFDIVLDVLHFEVLPPEALNGARAVWAPNWGTVRFPRPKVARVVV